jgi:hypothetical protein
MDPAKFAYCFDASAWIVYWRSYPIDIAPGLWEKFDELSRDGRLRTPVQVLEELKATHGEEDPLVQWILRHADCLLSMPSEHQLTVVRELLARPEFRGWVDPAKEIPEADPFVVAAALDWNRAGTCELFPLNWRVVSTEGSRSEKRQKVRIPVVCRAVGVEPVSPPA